MAQIKHNEIVEKDLFKPTIESTNLAIAATEQLIKNFGEILKVSNEIAQTTPLKGFENIKKSTDAINQNNKAVTGLQKVEAERLKLEQQLKDLNSDKIQQNEELKLQIARQKKINKDLAKQKLEEIGLLKKEEKGKKKVNELTEEELKEKLKLRKANKEAQDQLKQLLILEDEQAGTEEKLIARNKLLRMERRKLIETDDDYQERLEAINNEIDENSAKLEANTDAATQAKINVGRYTDSIREAIEGSAALNGISGQVGAAIGFLRKTFNLNVKALKEETEQKIKDIKASKDLTEEQKRAAIQNAKLTKNVKKTTRALKGIAAAGAAAAVASIGAAIKNTNEGGREFAKLTGQLEGGLDVVTGTAARLGNKLITDTQEGFKLATSALEAFTKSAKDGTDFGGGLLGTILKLQTAFFAAQNAAKEQAEETVKAGKATEDFEEIFDKLGEKIQKGAELQGKVAEAMFNLEISSRAASIEIAKLTKVQEEQERIADDNTRSFAERTAAAERSRIEIIKIREAELDLSNQRLNLLEQERQAREAAGTEDNIQFQQRLTEATLAQIEAEKQLVLSTFENTKQLRELKQDQLERDLDILIDGFDNQKSINERLISSEELNLIKRRDILKQTEELSDDSFKKQIATLQKLTSETIDANDLIQTSDAVALVAKIRNLGASEIIEGRILEVIRDRRTAEADLAEAAKELALEEVELRKRAGELSIELLGDQFEKERQLRTAEQEETLEEIRDLMANRVITTEEGNALIIAATKRFEEDLNKITLEQETSKIEQERQFEEARINQRAGDFETQKEFEKFKNEELKKIQIKALEDQLTALQDFQGKEFDLQREQLRGQIALLKADFEATAETEKKKAEAVKASTETISEATKRITDERVKAIDKEIKATEDRQSKLKELAKQGVEDASENLAFEQKKIAELERQRAKEIQRQKIVELGLTALKTYSSKVEAGDKNPLLSTIRDTSLLISFIRALPAFYEGTGEGTVADSLSPFMSGKDGYLIRADGAEKILNPAQSAMTGNMSADEIAALALRHRQGKISSGSSQNHEMINELRATRKAIESQKHLTAIDFDQYTGIVTYTTKNKGRIERAHKKLRIS